MANMYQTVDASVNGWKNATVRWGIYRRRRYVNCRMDQSVTSMLFFLSIPPSFHKPFTLQVTWNFIFAALLLNIIYIRSFQIGIQNFLTPNGFSSANLLVRSLFIVNNLVCCVPEPSQNAFRFHVYVSLYICSMRLCIYQNWLSSHEIVKLFKYRFTNFAKSRFIYLDNKAFHSYLRILKQTKVCTLKGVFKKMETSRWENIQTWNVFGRRRDLCIVSTTDHVEQWMVRILKDLPIWSFSLWNVIHNNAYKI